MTAKIGLVVALAGVAVGLAGCTTCHHKAYSLALIPNVCPDACASQRGRVNVMLIGGLDLFDDGGLKGLRDAVNAAGFTQVYYGHTHHGGWFSREMQRIAGDDPGARFILVGYGVGAGYAEQLANDATQSGMNVDGLVLLDPVKLPQMDCLLAEAPVLVIGSDRWTAHEDCPGCEVVRLPEVCHFAIATDPFTVKRTIDLLRESVARVPNDAMPVLVVPLIDDPAPLPAVIPDVAAATRTKPPAAP